VAHVAAVMPNQSESEPKFKSAAYELSIGKVTQYDYRSKDTGLDYLYKVSKEFHYLTSKCITLREIFLLPF
jgi:hypothetical protein